MGFNQLLQVNFCIRTPPFYNLCTYAELKNKISKLKGYQIIYIHHANSTSHINSIISFFNCYPFFVFPFHSFISFLHFIQYIKSSFFIHIIKPLQNTPLHQHLTPRINGTLLTIIILTRILTHFILFKTAHFGMTQILTFTHISIQ